MLWKICMNVRGRCVLPSCVLGCIFFKAGEMGEELSPVDLGGHTAQAVCAGQSHTCVLLDSKEVVCLGYNEFGQASDSCVELRFGVNAWFVVCIHSRKLSKPSRFPPYTE